MIEQAEFGRTGHRSSRVIFGAAAFVRMRQERADEYLDLLLEFGVNHIDTAASYGDSELRLAPWLSRHRDDVFLATKTGDRTGDAARASLERSLERLGVDQVDMIQLHNLVEDDDWDTAHAPGRRAGGAGAGSRRGSGALHRRHRSRRAHRRDARPQSRAVRLRLGPAPLQLCPAARRPSYRADVEALLATCAERRVAVQTIKSVARRRWPDDSNEPHYSWYEALPESDALDRAVGFVLSHPQLFLNTSSDARRLRPTLEAASAGGDAPSRDELEADVARLDIVPLFDGSELERI